MVYRYVKEHCDAYKHQVENPCPRANGEQKLGRVIIFTNKTLPIKVFPTTACHNKVHE
jgi:hypothetical protein